MSVWFIAHHGFVSLQNDSLTPENRRLLLQGMLQRFAELYTPVGVLECFNDTTPYTAQEGTIVLRTIDNSMQSTLKAFSDSLSRAGAQPEDDVFFFWADAPLYDPHYTQRIYDIHTKQRAHYSFNDGLPEEFTPRLFRVELLALIQHLSDKSAITRNFLFEIMAKDINAFDIETEVSQRDYRHLRISLTTDTPINSAITTAIGMCLKQDGHSDVLRAIDEHPEILRPAPAVAMIQITAQCPQACSHCVYPKLVPNPLLAGKQMSKSVFSEIISALASINPNMWISLSAMGEAALHPQFEQLLEVFQQHQGLQLLIETSGIGWDTTLVERLCRTMSGRLTWIISLDAADANEYQRLRGDGYDQALAFALWMVETNPQWTYVQVLRTDANEAQLRQFCDFWQAKNAKYILNKFSVFAGRVQNQSSVNFEPYQRFPCWHLKRELHIDIEGNIQRCGQLWGSQPTGLKLSSHTIQQIWAELSDWYLLHAKNQYPEPCKSCDEYYTFTF